jgi:flagellar protein FliO/FliZ
VTGLAQSASPMSVGSLTQLTLSLIAIVGLILAISWALKRLKLASPRGSGAIAVVDELRLGPRERIVLIRVGESQVLVGMGAAGMVSLTPLASPIVLAASAPAPAFAERLREMMKGQGGSSPGGSSPGGSR